MSFTDAELALALPRVRRYALKLLRDDVHADDLAQSVALAALRHREMFTPGSDRLNSLVSWLAKICFRTMLNERRFNRYWPASDQQYDPDKDLRVARDDAEAHCYAREVVRAIERLPAEQGRLVAEYAAADGEVTYDELALRSGLIVGTLRSRLSRGRARLAEITS